MPALNFQGEKPSGSIFLLLGQSLEHLVSEWWGKSRYCVVSTVQQSARSQYKDYLVGDTDHQREARKQLQEQATIDQTEQELDTQDDSEGILSDLEHEDAEDSKDAPCEVVEVPRRLRPGLERKLKSDDQDYAESADSSVNDEDFQGLKYERVQ